MVAEESKEIATSLKAMKRAIMYEEKAIETDKKLVKDCLFEIEKEKQIEIGEWELKRVNCLEKVNLGKKEREKIRNDEGNIVRELFERWVRKDSEWRKEKIEKSKSCGRYKIIVTEKIPEYMTKELKSKERKVLARFRVGNEERANKYWMSDEDKTCRVCKNKLETLEHIVSECVHRIGDAGDIE